MPVKRQTNRGFTLVEVMIVVAILAILTAIALPTYKEYVFRSHRSDAQAGLLQAAQWLERAATANGNYPTALPQALTWSSDTSKRYTISFVSGNSTTSYTLQAVPKAGGAQANDRCGTFRLSYNGEQSNTNLASGTSSKDCWGH
ncbi:type IV pilin protein [Comamonas sp. J-3]|jgi:type IV pilus assembly protein PilE|uniref:type IV pilin protein n=1 Tax=Comamonas trifloxystrobinivorans TaxID=3350256 RepID=UPI0037291DB5